jgi:hypothetical protein
MKLLPEGFSALLAPAAALPALLPMLAPADPVVAPQDEDPHPASYRPLTDPCWANAVVLASASAVANPIAAIFMAVFLWCCRHWKSGQAARRSHGSHYDFDSLAHLSGDKRRPTSTAIPASSTEDASAQSPAPKLQCRRSLRRHAESRSQSAGSIRSAGVLRALRDGLRLWRIQAARGAPGVGSRLVRNIS